MPALLGLSGISRFSKAVRTNHGAAILAALQQVRCISNLLLVVCRDLLVSHTAFLGAASKRLYCT